MRFLPLETGNEASVSPPSRTARSASRRVIDPPGPDPITDAGSIPPSRRILRTTGDATTPGPELCDETGVDFTGAGAGAWTGAGAGAGAGAGSGAGAGAGAGASATDAGAAGTATGAPATAFSSMTQTIAPV